MNNTKKQEKRSFNKEIGSIGEGIASKYLESKGYKVIDRNYLKKCGEIDIVAKREGNLYFIEVKSVSTDLRSSDVIHETVIHETGLLKPAKSKQTDQHRPEDNISPIKLRRMRNVISCYLLEKGIGEETDWHCHAITVLIDKKKRIGRVNIIKDIII